MRKKKIKTWESNGWIFPRFYLKASVCRSMKLRKTQEGQRKSTLTTLVEMGNNHRGTKNLQNIQRKMTYYWAGQKVGLNFSVTLYGKTGKKFLTNPIQKNLQLTWYLRMKTICFPPKIRNKTRISFSHHSYSTKYWKLLL